MPLCSIAAPVIAAAAAAAAADRAFEYLLLTTGTDEAK